MLRRADVFTGQNSEMTRAQLTVLSIFQDSEDAPRGLKHADTRSEELGPLDLGLEQPRGAGQGVQLSWGLPCISPDPGCVGCDGLH